MFSLRTVLIVSLLGLSLAGCRRDPNVAKKKYLESGMGFMDHGSYKNAAIQFQNAIKLDPKYGIAYYRLATVALKLKPPNMVLAIKDFRRAVELLKNNQAYPKEYRDSMVQLAHLDLAYLAKDKQILDDVEAYCDELFKDDPNSFEGFQVRGDLKVKRSVLVRADNPFEADRMLADATEDYRKADSIKPGDPGIALQMGLIFLQQKRYAEAEPYFRRILDHDKTDDRGYVNLYRAYMLDQKTAEAEEVLKEGVRNNPKTPLYLERLAYHYGVTGRRDEMLNVLNQIKAHSKDFEAVYRVVGDFYARLGDAESALREYREGIDKDDPKQKPVYQHAIIEVLLRQNKRAEALEVNNEILKENPKDPDAKSLAATFLLDQGEVAKAIQELTAVVTSTPDNAMAHYQLGRAYLASNKGDSKEAARQQFERAIALGNLLQARLGLAQLQVLKGEFEPALDSVREIQKRDPNNLASKLIESQAYLGQKKYAEADAILDLLTKSNPGSPDVFFQAGISAMIQHRYSDAQVAFLRAYQLNPANPKYLSGEVNAMVRQGDSQKAMAFLEGESAKEPNRLDIVFLLGTTAQSLGRYAESLEYFGKVLNGMDKNAASRADVYVQIAQTYRLQGDLANAVANLEKARQILPENETVLYELGIATDEAGRTAEAKQAYEACLRVNPNNVTSLNNLAFLLAQNSGDLDLALNYAQKAKGLEPDMPEVSDTYGWILLKKSMSAQAAQIFQALVKQVPNSSTYHFHLAKAYQQEGDVQKASDELREALKHSPSKGEQRDIQEMLSQMGRG